MKGQDKYKPVKPHDEKVCPEPIADASAEELALRVQKGSQECFAELIHRYGGRLLIFMQHKTGNINDAEDLVQDTFIRAFSNIQKYRSTSRFSTWLYTIASRLAVSYHRKMKLHSDTEQPRTAGDNNPLNAAAEKETGAALWSLAGMLAPNQYQVLYLKYAEGMSIKEIAKVTGRSQISIKVLLFRARMNLAGQLRGTKDEGRWKKDDGHETNRPSSIVNRPS
jgi:RNA polymerase sigma factor (sigma-70 family)